MGTIEKINTWFKRYPRLNAIKTHLALKVRLVQFIRLMEKLTADGIAQVIKLTSRIPFLKRWVIDIYCGIELTHTVRDEQHQYTFLIPSSHCFDRAQTLFRKEPATLKWIDSFVEDSVFYDIGANVGLYTVYAGVNNKAKTILAFEPETLNYSILNRNIFLNKLQDKVMALNLAFSDSIKLDRLYVSLWDAGSSLHNFGSKTDYIERLNQGLSQGCLSFSIDLFIEQFNPPFPQHIKIDVDGLENLILQGARETLKDARLKSVLIEMDDERIEDRHIRTMLQDMGFQVVVKTHTGLYESESKVYNYIFSRLLAVGV